jgi:hypothetical protein
VLRQDFGNLQDPKKIKQSKQERVSSCRGFGYVFVASFLGQKSLTFCLALLILSTILEPFTIALEAVRVRALLFCGFC